MKIKNEVKPTPNNTNATNATDAPAAPTPATSAAAQADSNGASHSVGAIDLLGNFISFTHMEAKQQNPENGVTDQHVEIEPTKMEV